MGFSQVVNHLLLLLQFAPVTFDPACDITVATSSWSYLAPSWFSLPALQVSPDGKTDLAVFEPISFYLPSPCIEFVPPPPTPGESPRPWRNEDGPCQAPPRRQSKVRRARTAVTSTDFVSSASWVQAFVADIYWMHIACIFWVSAEVLALRKLYRVLKARSAPRMIAIALGLVKNATTKTTSGLKSSLLGLSEATQRARLGCSAALSVCTSFVSLLFSLGCQLLDCIAQRVIAAAACQFQFLASLMACVFRSVEAVIVFSVIVATTSLCLVLATGSKASDYRAPAESAPSVGLKPCKSIVRRQQAVPRTDKPTKTANAESQRLNEMLNEVLRQNRILSRNLSSAKAECSRLLADIDNVHDKSAARSQHDSSTIKTLRRSEYRLKKAIAKSREEVQSPTPAPKATATTMTTATATAPSEGGHIKTSNKPTQRLRYVEAELESQLKKTSQVETELRGCRVSLTEKDDKITELVGANRNCAELISDYVRQLSAAQQQSSSQQDQNRLNKKLETEIDSLRQQLLSARQDISAQQSQRRSTEESYKEQVKKLQSEAAAAQARVSALEADNQTIQDSNAHNANIAQTLQQKLSETTQELSNLQAQDRPSEKPRAEDAAEIQRLNGEVSKAQQTIMSLQGELQSLQASAQGLDLKAQKLDSEKASLESVVAQLQNDISSQKQQLSTAQQEIAKARSDYGTLQNQASSLQGRNQDLDQRVKNFEADKSDLLRQLGDERQRSSDLQGRVSTLQTQSKSSTSQEATRKTTQLESEVEAGKRQVEFVRKQLESLRAEHARISTSLTDKLNESENDLNNMRAKYYTEQYHHDELKKKLIELDREAKENEKWATDADLDKMLCQDKLNEAEQTITRKDKYLAHSDKERKRLEKGLNEAQNECQILRKEHNEMKEENEVVRRRYDLLVQQGVRLPTEESVEDIIED